MTFLEITQVSKFYNTHEALKSTSLKVGKGKRIAIVGETGSGKTTLLKIIGGLEDTDSGNVLYKKNKVLGPSQKLIPGHKDIIYLSQHFTLPKFISVKEHLDNPYLISNDEADKIYHSCQIEHLLQKETRELSGGEKQRVALAKALTNLPEVLLLDEPFSNLDFIHKQTIKEVLDEVFANWGTTIIMVSHEPRDVLPWADEVVVMQSGSVAQTGDPKTIYSQPNTEYVAGLFGKYNLIDLNEYGLIESGQFSKIENMLVVRPEKLVLSDTKKGIVGKVINKKYFGSYDEIIFKTKSQELLIESTVNRYAIGDQLFVSVSVN